MAERDPRPRRSQSASAEHEARCLRCGRCCCRKIVVGETVFYTAEYCGYLDRTTRLCTVYDRRREMNPGCLSVEEGLRRGVFPRDCPYVRGVEGYVPPVEEPSEGAILSALAELGEAHGVEGEEMESIVRAVRGSSAAPGRGRSDA